jgi:DUF4097 and DUF4098 domain-containing protein YvlB
MNKQHYLMFFLFICALPALQASWWQSIKNKTQSFFSHPVQEITQKQIQNAKKIELYTKSGTITITSWQQNYSTVEAIKKNNPQEKIKVTTHLQDGVARVQTDGNGNVDYNILVPECTQLDIKTEQGNITIEQVHAPIFAQTLSGNITLKQCTCCYEATTHHGDITMSSTQMNDDCIWSANAHKGSITLYTLPTVHAHLQATAHGGKVWSSLPITLDARTTTLDAKAWKEFKQQAQGFIGEQSNKKIILSSQTGSIKIISYEEKED